MQVNASIDEVGHRPDQGGSDGDVPRRRVSARHRSRGTVSQVRLEPVVAQNVVSYVTVIDVPNPELKLKPGMTANVTVEIARADDVLRVPNAALRFRPAQVEASATAQAPAGAEVPAGNRSRHRRRGSRDARPSRVGAERRTAAAGPRATGHQRRHDDGDCRRRAGRERAGRDRDRRRAAPAPRSASRAARR